VRLPADFEGLDPRDETFIPSDPGYFAGPSRGLRSTAHDPKSYKNTFGGVKQQENDHANILRSYSINWAQRAQHLLGGLAAGAGICGKRPGHAAKANHDGTFVWNDRSITTGNDSLVSTGEN